MSKPTSSAYCLLVGSTALLWTCCAGCTQESDKVAGQNNRVQPVSSTPQNQWVSGAWTGEPITRPYLVDLDRSSQRPVKFSFGDASMLVQTPNGAKQVELIPTPEPDAPPGKAPADAQSGQSELVPTPAPTGDGSANSAPDISTESNPPAAEKMQPVGPALLADVGTEPEDYKDWPIPDVALLVTGRQHGYIEPCGCTGLERQKGGMARRFTFLRQLRDGGWTLLPLDAGDQIRRTGRQAEIKFQHTARALREMNYQAVGFGPDDLRLGVGELLSVAAAETPETALYVSANVVLIDPSLMPATKLVEANGRSIGVTSILDPSALEVPPGGDIHVHPMIEAAQQAIQQLAAKSSSFNVLLFYGDEEAGKELVRQVAGFDLIVACGGYGEPTYRPQTIDGSATQMIVTGDKGMYAGLVGLYSDQPMKYARVALTHEFEDAPEMRRLMADYQDQLKALGLEGLGLLPAVPHSAGQKFVGTAVCGKCHTDALDIWEGTPHAEATASIVTPKEQRGDVPRHFDPECLSCHVTGWNAQEYFPYLSGYLSQEASSHLLGSGCENCHGPGSDHAAAEEPGSNASEELRDQLRDAMKLSYANAREKCMSCHDLDNSPDFHAEGAFEDVYWPEVEH